MTGGMELITLRDREWNTKASRVQYRPLDDHSAAGLNEVNDPLRVPGDMSS